MNEHPNAIERRDLMIQDATEALLKLTNDIQRFQIPEAEKVSINSWFSAGLGLYREAAFNHFLPQIEAEMKLSMEVKNV